MILIKVLTEKDMQRILGKLSSKVQFIGGCTGLVGIIGQITTIKIIGNYVKIAINYCKSLNGNDIVFPAHAAVPGSTW